MKNITKEEWKHMKYLKIETNKGYFLKIGEVNSWIEIDKISKEDLINLLKSALNSDFEMDVFKEESIAHKAHQIVYKSIYEKFVNLIDNKSKFTDECDSLFKNAIEKYEGSKK